VTKIYALIAYDTSPLSRAHRFTEFQGVPVRVYKIDRLSRHPLVVYGSLDLNPTLLERLCGTLDIRFMDSKGNVLRRPFAFVFL
jgi:hypothetical protein